MSEREKLAEAMQKYIEAGGAIEKVPYGKRTIRVERPVPQSLWRPERAAESRLESEKSIPEPNSNQRKPNLSDDGH